MQLTQWLPFILLISGASLCRSSEVKAYVKSSFITSQPMPPKPTGTCNNNCSVEIQQQIRYRWTTYNTLLNVTAATVRYIVDPKSNTTKSTTIRSLPSGYKLPLTNDAGTVTAVVTDGIDRTSHIAYPTGFADYSGVYSWSGTLFTDGVCSTAISMTGTTLPNHPSLLPQPTGAIDADDPEGFHYYLTIEDGYALSADFYHDNFRSQGVANCTPYGRLVAPLVYMTGTRFLTMSETSYLTNAPTSTSALPSRVSVARSSAPASQAGTFVAPVVTSQTRTAMPAFSLPAGLFSLLLSGRSTVPAPTNPTVSTEGVVAKPSSSSGFSSASALDTNLASPVPSVSTIGAESRTAPLPASSLGDIRSHGGSAPSVLPAGNSGTRFAPGEPSLVSGILSSFMVNPALPASSTINSAHGLFASETSPAGMTNEATGRTQMPQSFPSSGPRFSSLDVVNTVAAESTFTLQGIASQSQGTMAVSEAAKTESTERADTFSSTQLRGSGTAAGTSASTIESAATNGPVPSRTIGGGSAPATGSGDASLQKGGAVKGRVMERWGCAWAFGFILWTGWSYNIIGSQ